jgi:hypothetical protein
MKKTPGGEAGGLFLLKSYPGHAPRIRLSRNDSGKVADCKPKPGKLIEWGARATPKDFDTAARIRLATWRRHVDKHDNPAQTAAVQHIEAAFTTLDEA